QTTIEIDRLYRISTDIESNIESALATITRLSEQREQYKKIRSGLHDAKKAKKALQDLEERETELVWDRQSTDQPNTICIASNCYSNCHAPCNMRLLDDFTSLGRWCMVFKNYRPLPVWDGASAVCKICQHPSAQHRHYRQVHVQKTRAVDPEKTRKFDSAETEEQRLEAAKIAAERKLTEIREDMASAQDTIRGLVESYNEISLSRNFAGHVRSAIQMLKLRKEELNTKPNTEPELQLIDESISKFEQQLAILAAEETKWHKAKALFQTVRDNMPGAPLSPRLRPSNVNQGPFDLEDYHDESKQSGLPQHQSQTTAATVYDFTAPDGRRFQILDTPGLADTRGIKQDKIHKEEINNAIQNTVMTIDAVIIVANGTVQRLTVATDYALNIICSMFPRSIIDNIGFMFTNAGPGLSNFDTSSLHPELRGSRTWEMQNPLAILKSYHSAVANKRPSAAQVHKKVIASYDETVETLNEWLEWLDTREVQTTIEIDRLYRISTDIESRIDSTLATMALLSEQHQQYERIRANLQDAKRAKSALEDMEKREKELVWERKTTDQPNTICITSGCYSNCHSPCNMRLTEDYTSLGRWCKVFKNWGPLPVWDGASSTCKICKHPSKEHRHYTQIHIQKPRVVDQEKKRQLAGAATEEEQLQVATATAERRLTEINEEMASAQDTIRILVENYNESSLSRNFAGHVRSAIQMLKLRKEDLNTKPGTDAELQLIGESISKFEQQLALLAAQEAQ
ncbi:hypothetical protein FRC06_008553, partial [Ceratobasidium sp. 370]